MKIKGVDAVGTAINICSLGYGRNFKNGRHALIYIGATPKQHSSGGKVIMMELVNMAEVKRLAQFSIKVHW
jgi:transposase